MDNQEIIINQIIKKILFNDKSSLVQKGLDTISRQAALETVRTMHKRCDTGSVEDYRDLLVDCFKNLPSAQSDRKTGWWLIREGISDAQCSECGMYFNDVYDMENSDAFCRHCGTKMEGLKVV